MAALCSALSALPKFYLWKKNQKTTNVWYRKAHLGYGLPEVQPHGGKIQRTVCTVEIHDDNTLDSAQIDLGKGKLILDYVALQVRQLFQNQSWHRYTHGKFWKFQQNGPTSTPHTTWQQAEGETSSPGLCVSHHLHQPCCHPCANPCSPSQVQHSLRCSALPATSAYSALCNLQPFLPPQQRGEAQFPSCLI